MSFFLYRDKIVWDARLVVASLVLSSIILNYLPFGYWLGILPATYITVGLGVMNPKRIGVIGLADYSYGIISVRHGRAVNRRPYVSVVPPIVHEYLDITSAECAGWRDILVLA